MLNKMDCTLLIFPAHNWLSTDLPFKVPKDQDMKVIACRDLFISVYYQVLTKNKRKTNYNQRNIVPSYYIGKSLRWFFVCNVRWL